MGAVVGEDLGEGVSEDWDEGLVVSEPDDPAGEGGPAGPSGGAVATVIDARPGWSAPGSATAVGRVNHAMVAPARRATASAAATLPREL